MLKTAANGHAPLQAFVRKQTALLDHLLPHTRSIMRITRQIIAFLADMFSRNSPVRCRLPDGSMVMISGRGHLVKPFPVLVQFVS